MYRRQHCITENEFFEGLIYCVNFEAPELILTRLNSTEMRRFRVRIDEFRTVKSKEDLIAVGYPPPWTLENVQTIYLAMGDR